MIFESLDFKLFAMLIMNHDNLMLSILIYFSIQSSLPFMWKQIDKDQSYVLYVLAVPYLF